MATDCIAQTTFRFQEKSKPVIAAFDMAHASSDGGAVLLKAIDTRLGLTARLADALPDARQPGKVRHQVIEWLRQRVFGVACGSAECTAAQVTLLRDRLLKVAVWIERSVRRIVRPLPTAFPWLRPWQQLARAGGATS